MKLYTVELTARGSGDVTEWTGEAVCTLDALIRARQSVWPVLHFAKVTDSK